jgi:hypothetical protein
MIIGISGKKFSGKDTIADYLVSNHNFIKYSFANPVKQITKILFDFDDSELYESNKEKVNKKWNITPRNAMQKIGTEFGQYYLHQLFPNLNCNKKLFWTLKAVDFCEKNSDKNIVIPDFRFVHEIEEFRKISNFKLWNVKRNTINEDIHISETCLDNYQNFDLIIDNNYSKEELYQIINNIINT